MFNLFKMKEPKMSELEKLKNEIKKDLKNHFCLYSVFGTIARYKLNPAEFDCAYYIQEEINNGDYLDAISFIESVNLHNSFDMVDIIKKCIKNEPAFSPFEVCKLSNDQFKEVFEFWFDSAIKNGHYLSAANYVKKYKMFDYLPKIHNLIENLLENGEVMEAIDIAKQINIDIKKMGVEKAIIKQITEQKFEDARFEIKELGLNCKDFGIHMESL